MHEDHPEGDRGEDYPSAAAIFILSESEFRVGHRTSGGELHVEEGNSKFVVMLLYDH